MSISPHRIIHTQRLHRWTAWWDRNWLRVLVTFSLVLILITVGLVAVGVTRHYQP